MARKSPLGVLAQILSALVNVPEKTVQDGPHACASAVHSPDGCTGQGWASPKLEAGLSSRSPAWKKGPEGLGHFSLISQAINRSMVPTWDTGTKRWRIIL